MLRDADRFWLRWRVIDRHPSIRLQNPFVRQILVIALLAAGWISIALSVVNAAPNTGPDRPFSVEWRIVVPPAPHLRGAAFVPGTRNAVVVGDSGTVLRTDDGGGTWKRAKLPSEFKSSLSTLVFTSPSRAVAVGEDGAILWSVDGGESWDLGDVSGTVGHLRALSFTSALNGVAVGDTGTILRTIDGGKTWKRAKTPPAGLGDLKAVKFRDDSIGIAVGADETIVATADSGESWQLSPLSPKQTPSRLPNSKLVLSTVMFFGEMTVIAAGGDINRFGPGSNRFGQGSETSEQPIIRSDDGGKTWRREQLPPGIAANLSSLASLDGKGVFAVGRGANVWHSVDRKAFSSSGFGAAIFFAGAAEQDWKRVELPSGSASELRNILVTSSTTVIAVGSSGSVLRSDGGADWSVATLPAGTRKNIEVIAFSDHDHGIIAGDDGLIMWTQNGGRSFHRSILPAEIETESLRALALTDQKHAVAVGSSTKVVRTEDRGRTWSEAKVRGSAVADLHTVKFMNPLLGLTIGQSGAIFRTDDGGKTWTPGKMPDVVKSDLLDVAFVDSSRAIVVGNDGIVLKTEDAGVSWEQINSGVTTRLRAVIFSSPTAGTIVGDVGTILGTNNGGQTWTPANRPSGLGDFNAISFSDASKGVAVGKTIVWTADGGKSWEKTKQQPSRLGNLRAVVFADALNGVAVGDAESVDNIQTGTIVWTADGGKNWTRATLVGDGAIPGGNVTSVSLTASGSGVAIAGATILSTRDNGRKWALGSIASRHGDLDLRRIVLDGTAGIGIAVGGRGVRLATEAPNYAAYLKEPSHAVRQSLDGQIEVDVLTIDDEGDAVRSIAVEYNVVRKDRDADWKPLTRSLTKSKADGRWRLTWSPRDELIGNSATIEHRVSLDDGGAPVAAMVLNPVVFRSLWDRISEYQATLWTIVGVASVAALYLVPVSLLFWVAPARLALAGSGTLIAFGEAAESGSAWGRAVSALLRQLALPWFKRRRRVRDAWLAAYRKRETSFDKLAKEVREEFLKQDDVLDAWVARRLAPARDALAQHPLYKARSTYIPFPVRKGDASTGETIEQPGPRAFAQVFARDRAILCIIGGGGSGKTTLAFAFARWAMADLPERLMAHPAIPVIVAEETKDLVAAVAANLSRMVGSEKELETEILHALLRRKRVLVIVDALSERSAETQQHVFQLYGTDTPINALLVTTRREAQFGPLEYTQAYPQPIDLRLLVPFILEYLRRKELTNNFDGRQQLAIAQRILQIVEKGGGLTVTPLLVTLFVDTAVKRGGVAGQIENLPVDVPEVYLDYLDRLDAVGSAVRSGDERATMHKTAFILAQTCLGVDLVPTDWRRDQAEQRLADADVAETRSLTDRLIANGVVQERVVAGLSMLRFQFDPVAEYLAAIAVCRTLASDKAGWLALIEQLTRMQTYPEGIQGYLNALTVCYESYRNPLKLSDVDFPWSTGKSDPFLPGRL